MNVKDIFALRLKKLREQRKLSQAELAVNLKVSRGSISYYENAERTPDIEFLAAVSNYFDVSFDFLLGRTDMYGEHQKKVFEESVDEFMKASYRDTKMFLALTNFFKAFNRSAGLRSLEQQFLSEQFTTVICSLEGIAKKINDLPDILEDYALEYAHLFQKIGGGVAIDEDEVITEITKMRFRSEYENITTALSDIQKILTKQYEKELRINTDYS